jgi:hypothetical protein
MAEEKEPEKGLMHSFFGGELCEGCKGLILVAFIAPSHGDVGSIAQALSSHHKEVEAEGSVLASMAGGPGKKMGVATMATPFTDPFKDV